MIKKSLLRLLLVTALVACNKFEMPDEVNSDFSLNCLRWGDTISVCEGYLDTEKISGYLKIYVYTEDLYHGTSLNLCGADLKVKTGNLLHNYFVESETKDNLVCLDAAENDVQWWWQPDNVLNISWEDIFFNINIDSCLYDDSHCAVIGNGYII